MMPSATLPASSTSSGRGSERRTGSSAIHWMMSERDCDVPNAVCAGGTQNHCAWGPFQDPSKDRPMQSVMASWNFLQKSSTSDRSEVELAVTVMLFGLLMWSPVRDCVRLGSWGAEALIPGCCCLSFRKPLRNLRTLVVVVVGVTSFNRSALVSRTVVSC